MRALEFITCHVIYNLAYTCLQISIENHPRVYYANPIGTVNGRTSYTSNDGEYGIWYDGRNWAIGLDSVPVFKDVEENWNGVFHFVTSREKCPNNLDPWTWKYRDGYVWENTQVGLSIVCENLKKKKNLIPKKDFFG